MSNVKTKKQTDDLSYLESLGPIGGNDLSSDEIAIPYIKVVEKLSIEVDEGTAKYGDVINSITKEYLLDENKELEFVVLKHYVNYRVSEGGKFIDSSLDGINWTSGNKYPVNDLWKYRAYNFIVILKKDFEKAHVSTYIFSCNGGRAKVGKQLVNELAQKCISQGLPIFAKPFILKPLEAQNKDGKKYWTWSLKESDNKYITAAEVDKLIPVLALVERKQFVLPETIDAINVDRL